MPLRLPLLLSVALLAAAPAASQEAGAPEELIERVSAHLAAGARALQAGDPATAEAELTAATELVPGMKEAWLALAVARERGGRSFEALEAARRAQELAPDDPAVLAAVGRQLARLGAVDEALAAFSRLRELDPGNLEAVMVPALLLRDVGRNDLAIELLRSGREAGIDHPALLEELGLRLLAEGRAEEAADLLAGALERHPGVAALERSYGLALAALPERRDEAIDWLRRSGTAEEDGRVALELGSLLLERGDLDAAVELLRRAVERLPDSPEAWYRLGSALQQRGETGEARQALERFRQLSQQSDRSDWDEKKIGLALNEVQALAQSDRLDDALAALEPLLEARPEEDRALALRAKVLFSLQRIEEARADAAAAARLVPSVAEYHYLEGLALLALDRPAEAIASLRRAQAIDDRNPDVWLRLGQASLGSGDPEAALQAFERAEALGAEGPALRRSWAAALDLLGRDEEAEAQRRRAGPP